MANKRTARAHRQPRHLQPLPDPLMERDPVELDRVGMELAFDLDPVELIEPIYAGIAHDVGKSRDPLEVECGIAEWLAVMTDTITAGVPDGEADEALATFFGALIDAARRDATPRALALLRALSVLSDTAPAVAAAAAAAELAESGVTDRGWVTKLGQLQPTTCLRYGDLSGRQESLIAGFSYGRAEHAITVLIDHDLGGGIKDCWITAEPEKARQQIVGMLADDPEVDVGTIDWVRAQRILTTALGRPLCAIDDDQVSDTAANLALLRRRVRVLDGDSWQPAGIRVRARRSHAAQDSLFGD